jgi:hypothetical protein
MCLVERQCPAQTPGAGGIPQLSRIWHAGVGSGLRRGARQRGFSLGTGFGTNALGSKVEHDLALGIVRSGRMLSSNWEVLGEVFGGVQHDPHDRLLVGATALLCYSGVNTHMFFAGLNWFY